MFDSESDRLPDLVRVDGYLDVRNVALVRSQVNAVLDAATGDVTLDLAGVDVIDAAGLGMLTAAHLRVERSGHHLVLRNCTSQLRRVLAVTHLNRIFHIDRSTLQLSA